MANTFGVIAVEIRVRTHGHTPAAKVGVGTGADTDAEVRHIYAVAAALVARWRVDVGACGAARAASKGAALADAPALPVAIVVAAANVLVRADAVTGAALIVTASADALPARRLVNTVAFSIVTAKTAAQAADTFTPAAIVIADHTYPIAPEHIIDAFTARGVTVGCVRARHLAFAACVIPRRTDTVA